ncbi:MAG TPA: hypothetical protein VIH42_13350 [Thermoguttaceae bacterium]
MNRANHFTAPTTLVLAVLATSALVYNMLAMQLHRDELFLRKGTLEGVGVIALSGFVVIFLFNIVSFLWLLASHRRQSTIGKMVALALGALCMIFLIVDKVMIDEIGREYRLGWETLGEWIILYSAMTVQLIYGLVVFTYLFLEHRGSQQIQPQVFSLCDETVFVTAQIMGVISGAIGLWMNYTFIRRQMHSEDLLFLLPLYLLILMPYGLTVLYWIMMRLGVRLIDWYDEKQWRNVACSGLITLLLSIPGMALLFLISQPLYMLWFPHYLFLIMLLLSASTIILFKYTA